MRYLWLLAALGCFLNAEVVDAQISTHGNCNSFTSISFNPDETADAFVSLNLKDILTGTAAQSATETNVDTFVMPLSMRALSISVVVDVAPGGTDIWAVTVRDDASSTNQPTCSITGASTACSSTSYGAQIAAGSKVDILVDQTANPAVAAEMLVGVCWGA